MSRMWEIREDYEPRRRHHDYYSRHSSEDRSDYDEGYDCGYEDGYRAAMKEAKRAYSETR